MILMVVKVRVMVLFVGIVIVYIYLFLCVYGDGNFGDIIIFFDDVYCLLYWGLVINVYCKILFKLFENKNYWGIYVYDRLFL